MTLYKGKYRIKSARYPGWDYRARGWYFVTICSYHQVHLFGEVHWGRMCLSQIGAIAESELLGLATHYKNVQLDSHVVMPNHVHAVIMIEGDHAFSPNPERLSRPPGILPAGGSLSAVVRSYKAGVTHRSRQMGFNQEIWQSRFYDKILRNDKIINAVREYIRNNPGNWCQDSESTISP